MQDLLGRTAVITGAASGIGLAVAHRLGAAGMRLMLADIEEAPLVAAETALREAGHEVHSMVVDVRDLEQVQSLEAESRERFGKVHVLCNNAGVAAGGPVAGLDDLELWRWTIDVDLWGVIYGCKVFLPAMIEHGEPGHVVNTASMAGLGSVPMLGAYNVSKYGVVALSETMYQELGLAGSSIGVSVLCPAWVQTAIAESDRNLPPELARDSADAKPAGGAAGDLVASGIPPAVVADAVHDAVLANDFWILTHPEGKPGILDRARRIAEGLNPPLFSWPEA